MAIHFKDSPQRVSERSSIHLNTTNRIDEEQSGLYHAFASKDDATHCASLPVIFCLSANGARCKTTTRTCVVLHDASHLKLRIHGKDCESLFGSLGLFKAAAALRANVEFR
mmetsp:Transcript_17338/g.33883  ORF Transcript_17338/g.33883 Transcript_17338/m.33883 type:complete len:111 (+) Transcript_17338:149-481(+)